MQIQPELKSVLKRLRLSGILATLPDRWAYARQEKLDYPQFLELVLSDEVERRDHKHLENRLQDAGFEEECTLERFDWSAKIRIDKTRLMELFSLHFIGGGVRGHLALGNFQAHPNFASDGIQQWISMPEAPARRAQVRGGPKLSDAAWAVAVRARRPTARQSSDTESTVPLQGLLV